MEVFCRIFRGHDGLAVAASISVRRSRNSANEDVLTKISSDLFIVGLGRVGQILLALVSMRVMTRFLSGAEVGHVYLVLSLASYFSLVFISPVGQYINRRIHRWHQEKSLLSRFSLYNLYVMAVSAGAIPVLYSVRYAFGIGAGFPVVALLLTVAALIYFGTWNSTLIPALNMLNFRRSFVGLTVFTLVFSLAFSMLFVLSVQRTALFWLLGQISGLLLLSAAALYYFFRKVLVDSSVPVQFRGGALSGIYKFSLPLLVTSFFMWVQGQSYRVVVEKNIGAEFLGLLAVGLGVASSIGAAVESMLQQIYYPIYYREINTEDHEHRTAAWRKMAGVMLPLYLLVMLFVSFLADHLVTVLVDHKFRAAALFTVFGAWIEFSRVSTNILASVAHSEMRTDHLATPFAFGGGVTAAGVIVGSLLPGYRYYVPLALLLGGMCTLYLMLRSMRKIMPLRIDRAQLKLAATLSLPLPLALLIPNRGASVLVSLGVLMVFGLYLTWAQYYLYRRSCVEVLGQ